LLQPGRVCIERNEVFNRKRQRRKIEELKINLAFEKTSDGCFDGAWAALRRTNPTPAALLCIEWIDILFFWNLLVCMWRRGIKREDGLSKECVKLMIPGSC
jgi:hypothetical protein